MSDPENSAAPAEPPRQPAVTGGDSSPADPSAATRSGPSYVFFGVVAAICLLLDVISKAWAEVVLSNPARTDVSIAVIEHHLSFTLAYNPGGAWGLAQKTSEVIRRPFFVLVSIAAVVFIFSLYSRLAPGQKALKWGLPLVLGGALGNLADRIVRSNVVDFIDYRADWVRSMNEWVARVAPNWNVTDHWPTFNVADIAICAGVVLMAVDMITSRREPEAPPHEKPREPADTGPSEPQPNSTS